MYLDLADATGGLTDRHRAYLPWQMLAMELIALYDDTIDLTPRRSGAPTYTSQHGAAAASALSGFLFSTLVERTAAIVPELTPMLIGAPVSTASSFVIDVVESGYRLEGDETLWFDRVPEQLESELARGLGTLGIAYHFSGERLRRRLRVPHRARQRDRRRGGDRESAEAW